MNCSCCKIQSLNLLALSMEGRAQFSIRAMHAVLYRQ
ncbi:hypothetical protein OIU77_022043 [Salix suchowensis]|uniref:Uncharacterized protein n=1 Tax=Salix suchowensis TaxID=1278906 RepID=A0ABQ9CF74_9ROSI|nr:hypothetical protein OIU77_022043 [Salix suchowensis]